MKFIFKCFHEDKFDACVMVLNAAMPECNSWCYKCPECGKEIIVSIDTHEERSKE